MENIKDLGFESKLVHAGDFKDEFGSAVTPIYQTSTFSFKNAQHGADCFAGEADGYIYTRVGNPTIDALENKLAALENGYRGIAFSSGMSAVSGVYMTFLHQGAHMVATGAIYGASRAIVSSHFQKFGVEATFVDTANLAEIEKSIRPNTKLLYIETPANPTITLTDIAGAAEIAHKHGIPLVVDNTFSSPYLQRPLDLGADVVLHSLTKFINGHADIVGGALIAKTPELHAELVKTRNYLGGNMDPTQAYMVIRGAKTLAIRVERAQENAMKVAQFLENHPKVDWIKYPGLTSFDQHELAKKQMFGFGAMMSFGVKGGFEAGKTVMDNVQLAKLAVSLGGVETLIQHPASMTHAAMQPEERMQAGITDDLVRYAIGIESVEDIIHDIDQALAKI